MNAGRFDTALLRTDFVRVTAIHMAERSGDTSMLVTMDRPLRAGVWIVRAFRQRDICRAPADRKSTRLNSSH